VDILRVINGNNATFLTVAPNLFEENTTLSINADAALNIDLAQTSQLGKHHSGVYFYKVELNRDSLSEKDYTLKIIKIFILE